MTKYRTSNHKAHLSIPLDLHNMVFQLKLMQANLLQLWQHSNPLILYVYDLVLEIHWHILYLYDIYYFYAIHIILITSHSNKPILIIHRYNTLTLSFLYIQFFIINHHHLQILKLKIMFLLL